MIEVPRSESSKAVQARIFSARASYCKKQGTFLVVVDVTNLDCASGTDSVCYRQKWWEVEGLIHFFSRGKASEAQSIDRVNAKSPKTILLAFIL